MTEFYGNPKEHDNFFFFFEYIYIFFLITLSGYNHASNNKHLVPIFKAKVLG